MYMQLASILGAVGQLVLDGQVQVLHELRMETKQEAEEFASLQRDEGGREEWKEGSYGKRNGPRLSYQVPLYILHLEEPTCTCTVTCSVLGEPMSTTNGFMGSW